MNRAILAILLITLSGDTSGLLHSLDLLPHPVPWANVEMSKLVVGMANLALANKGELRAAAALPSAPGLGAISYKYVD